MLKIYFMIIFFLVLCVIIDGIVEELFDDLWKNLKPSNSKNLKKQKFGGINAIKEETVHYNEMNEQQNANKIEMEDTKPKLLQKIKKESFTKIKEPKIELDQLIEESFENEFDEQADQNDSFTEQSNSTDDEDYNNMNGKRRNEMDILNGFNLMKKELRCNYKTLTIVQFEFEIAKKLDTNRTDIYKLKNKLGQKRENRTEESEERKMELIRKFDQLRKEKIYGFKYDVKKRNKIEYEVAKKLGINRKKIYKWKRELKKEISIKKKFSFSNEQKTEKTKQFEKIKEEFSKKFNLEANRKIEIKIAAKLGVVWETIYRWKRRKLGLTIPKRTFYTDAEKMEYVKRSEEMEIKNRISGRKIAEKLGIDKKNLLRWKKKFST